jgi:malate permease and related proteins
MLSALLLVSTMFLAGSICTRFGVFDDAGADVINRFVVYVSLPALVLHVVPKLHWQPELALLAIVAWATLLIAALTVAGLARAFSWPRPVLGALLVCVPLGNTSFLGAPLIAALRGDDALQYALIYDQLGSFLALSTYALFVLARFSGEGTPPFATMARRIATFPPFVALLLALPLPPLPAELDAVLGRVGDTLSPLAMFAAGMRLRLRLPAERSALVSGLAVKMLLVPACAFLIVRAWGEPGLLGDVAVLEAAMPPMLSAAALASMAGLAPELCAALAGYGIVLAFALVPLLAALL